MFAVTEEKNMEVCPKAGKILFFFFSPAAHIYTTSLFIQTCYCFISCSLCDHVGKVFPAQSHELVPYHRQSRVPCLEK